jgi:carbamoyltransferase
MPADTWWELEQHSLAAWSQESPALIVGHANSVHDSAIALVFGDCIWAESIERHIQCKRALGAFGAFYVFRSLQRALASLGVNPDRVEDVVLRRGWVVSPAWRAECASALSRNGAESDGFISWCAAALAMDTVSEVQLGWALRGHFPLVDRGCAHQPEDENFNSRLLGAFARGERPARVRIAETPHHLAHAANAVFTSPFDECVIMVVDGSGENDSIAFFHHVGGDFRLLSTTGSEHSLGWLYEIVTQLCGFQHWEGEEWKVMGLAAYGKQRPELYDFFRSRTEVRGLSLELHFGPRWVEELVRLTGPIRSPEDGNVERSADLARNFQDYFADVIVELAKAAGDLGFSENLAYAGGCALNSSANGRILSGTRFRRLHVPSAPADDGNALGAALYEKHVVRAEARRPAVASPYLGSDVDLAEVERVLDHGGLAARRFDDENALCCEVAGMLDAGHIVGWMQGRAEFGPRALGNRSILADPRPADMRHRINHRVKLREEFRPLAPAILHEHGPDWFDPYEESPYMERAVPFRPEVRGRVPAVVHLDGTGRLQTVRREWNSLFHRLLEHFYLRTGVPLLVNTSFNVMGKPMVHSSHDAITVFYTSGLTALAIGPYLLVK